jgi:Uma2 family endonuclease
LSEKDATTKYELIDGVVYFMSPGASQAHQEVSRELFRQFANFLEGKPCKVFHPPFDVCLNALGDFDRTVVQPDILVVCDKSKLDGKRCNGAPDLIIEILSPSTKRHDIYRKFKAYLHAGVREYWVVDTDDKTIIVYVLRDGQYTADAYDEESAVPVHVLDGCVIDARKVFLQMNSGEDIHGEN